MIINNRNKNEIKKNTGKKYWTTFIYSGTINKYLFQLI